MTNHHQSQNTSLPMTTSPLILSVTLCARQRAHLAAAEGDRARYWREMAACQYLLGWWDSAEDFDALAQRQP